MANYVRIKPNDGPVQRPRLRKELPRPEWPNQPTLTDVPCARIISARLCQPNLGVIPNAAYIAVDRLQGPRGRSEAARYKKLNDGFPITLSCCGADIHDKLNTT